MAGHAGTTICQGKFEVLRSWLTAVVKRLTLSHSILPLYDYKSSFSESWRIQLLEVSLWRRSFCETCSPFDTALFSLYSTPSSVTARLLKWLTES